MREAVPCPCKSQSCHNWLVRPEAFLQGVGFTEIQAKAVAYLLDNPMTTRQFARGYDRLHQAGPLSTE